MVLQTREKNKKGSGESVFKKEPLPNHTLSEQERWDIIRSALIDKGLITHQVDSFDRYINNGIERVISDEPDIEVSYKKGCKYRVSFGDVYVAPPTVIDENRVSRPLYPLEARHRDMTYDAPVHVDITETFEEEKDGKVEKEVITHKRVVIFRTPIMLGSEKCNLSSLSDSQRIKEGECEYDKGGYFVIKGKERVLVGQLRGIYNEPLVFASSEDKFKYECEIRSMSEETAHSVLLKAMFGSDDKTIVFSLPYIRELVPVGVVFKALGYTDEKTILSLISLSSPQCKKYTKTIIRDSYFVQTREEALDYLGKYVMHPIADNKRRDYAKQVIETELFPHLGVTATNKEKCFFLGRMINRLISTSVGIRQEDDKDDYKNKRVEMAGHLCRELVRTLFKRWSRDIQKNLEKKKQRPNIRSVISRSPSITKGLLYCFSTGNWGVPKNYMRLGVSQVLSRMTYGATLSHVRRVIIPVGKKGKNPKIRQINSSQFFFICPSETPEGQTVGIVLNLALLTMVSGRISTALVREVIEKVEGLVLVEAFDPYLKEEDWTTVILNGVIVGFVQDVDSFRDKVNILRDSYILDKAGVSLSYNEFENELQIFSDEGRVMRPVFTCNKSGKLNLGENRQSIALTYSNQTNNTISLWDRLVENDYIRYVDNLEVEDSTIAMSEDDLIRFKCDYMEIDPAMMLGVIASIIPFPEHSQSPRICYGASMGKQAIGMPALNYPLRTDTELNILNYGQKPLVATEPSRVMGFNDMPCGLNAIVAIATYTGNNQEDSVIMNKSAIERGMYHIASLRTLTVKEVRNGIREFESIGLPPMESRKRDANYSYLDERGIVRKRYKGGAVYVEKGDVIVGKILTKSSKSGIEDKIDMSVVIKSGEEGYIHEIIETTGAGGYTLIKIVIRQTKIPEVGDKFASREAQKGTCGMIYSQEDMPFNSEGISPDIIINPHCIPSRMTINQLQECILGKSCAVEGVSVGDSTPFSSNSIGVTEELCNRLKGCGYQQHGWEMLYNGMTGEPMKALIFMGPIYYQRLKHIVKDKIHARAQGRITTLTRQPLPGRSNDGGLRFGEMERDCMISYGASAMLLDRLFHNSDPYLINICNKCGNVATTPTECKICNSSEISKCNMPYASKLLVQSLNALMIKTGITAKS